VPVFTALRHLLRDMRGQKLRTFLTTCGIIWGTVAVSLLLAFGQGLHDKVMRDMRGLGEAIVIAWPSVTSIPHEGMGKGRRIRMTEDDIGLIRARCRGLLGISSETREELTLRWQAKTVTADVAGVSPVFADLRNLVPSPGGRFINPLDEKGRRRVAFVGDKIAGEIFGGADPVGETVTLGNSPFTVVGVLRHKEQDSNYSGRDENVVFIPGSTLRTLTGRTTINNFIFKAARSTDTDRVKERVLGIMAKRYRFDPSDKEAMPMWDTTEMFQFFDTFMLAFKLFLGIVGSLTLVVGGIGVSNIMNVVVEERTREIGIKMALGARRSFILSQFLLESLLVTAAGGAIGLLLAGAICLAVSSAGLQEFIGTPVISARVALLTTSILGFIGLLAGYFPARDAADMDPVIAMKV